MGEGCLWTGRSNGLLADLIAADNRQLLIISHAEIGHSPSAKVRVMERGVVLTDHVVEKKGTGASWLISRIVGMCTVGCNLFGVIEGILSVAVACQLYIVAGPVKVGFGEESNICTNGFDILEANLV